MLFSFKPMAERKIKIQRRSQNRFVLTACAFYLIALILMGSKLMADQECEPMTHFEGCNISNSEVNDEK